MEPTLGTEPQTAAVILGREGKDYSCGTAETYRALTGWAPLGWRAESLRTCPGTLLLAFTLVLLGRSAHHHGGSIF